MHVQDIEDLLWFEDLSKVHLVLHSYAGILAGPLVERAEDGLASVVYLGAFITGSGQSLLDVEPPETAARYREQVEENGEGWYVPASDSFLEQWGITDEAIRRWVGPRLTDFPFRCQAEPTHFDPQPLARLRKVYPWRPVGRLMRSTAATT